MDVRGKLALVTGAATESGAKSLCNCRPRARR